MPLAPHQNARLPRQILLYQLSCGQRTRGGQRNTLKVTNWENLAADRPLLCRVIHRATACFKSDGLLNYAEKRQGGKWNGGTKTCKLQFHWNILPLQIKNRALGSPHNPRSLDLTRRHRRSEPGLRDLLPPYILRRPESANKDRSLTDVFLFSVDHRW